MIARCDGGINWTWYVEYYQATPKTVILSKVWRVHNGEEGHPKVDDEGVLARIAEGDGRIVRALLLTKVVNCTRKVVAEFGVNNPRSIFSY